MTDTVAAVNEQSQDALERRRSIAADFQHVFGTPEGKRVLKYIRNQVLCAGTRLKVPSGEHAVYLCGRRDAAIEIDDIMDFDFRAETKTAVVKTRAADRWNRAAARANGDQQ